MITAADREDMIAAVLGCFRSGEDKRLKVSGIVLSGGIMPAAPMMEQLNRARIPVLLARSDTYDVATSIHDMTVKIRPRDKEKIAAAVKLIRDNVDLESILRGI
jgi:BioD-like phosphotransacetylase family protein